MATNFFLYMFIYSNFLFHIINIAKLLYSKSVISCQTKLTNCLNIFKIYLEHLIIISVALKED